MNKNRKIRNFLLLKNIQFKLTLKFFALSMISFFIFSLIIYYQLWPHLSNFIPQDVKETITTNIYFILLWDIGIFFVIFFLLGIILTHKIAGPIYQIEQKLDRALHGDEIEFIHLRKGDDLQELAERENNILFMLKESKKKQN